MARILAELGLEETKKPILGNIFRRGIEEAKKEAIRFPGRLLGIQQAPERLVQEPEKLARELSFGFPLIAGERALRTLAIQKALKEPFKPSEILTRDRRYTEIPGVEEAMRRGLAGVAPFGLKGIAAKAPVPLMNVGAELAGILTLGAGTGILQEAIRGLRPEQLTLKATKQVGEKLLKQPSYQNLISRKAQQTGYATEEIHNATLREVSKQLQRKPYLDKLRVGLGERGFAGIREEPKLLPFVKEGIKRKAKITQLPRGEEFVLKGLPYRTGLSPRQQLAREQKRIQEETLGFILKGKPKTIEIPKEGMATSAQKRYAHILARQKAMITPEGKTKPQYRKLAQGIVGKKSMKDMTEEEANAFIGSLKSISEPYYKSTGQLVPPSIPEIKKLVPEGFFSREFKTPTPLKHLTSQQYYAEQLGVGSLVKPLELAKQNLDLETRALNNAIEQQAKLINKDVPLQQKLMSGLANRPTPAMEEMRGLLDTYEEAPDFLSPEKKQIFNWFRNLNRTMLKGQNEVGEKLGLPPIKYRKAYVRHIADITAQEILQGKYPFPEGLKYWADRIVGKTIHNPMAMQRQLADDLENYFTKDLIYATKAMVRTGLKVIHLSQPLRAFSEQLGGLSKDIPTYKNLTPEQLNRIREVSVIPASTKKWLIEYVNQVIKGQQTYLDEAVNKMVTDSGLGVLLNKVLKPFGRSLSRKPITNTFRTVGRGIIHGVMGWIPRQLVRNKFQLFQNLSLYSIKANLKGFLPKSVDKNLEELINKSVFWKSYTGVEETPRDVKNLLERAWMAPYQWTAVSNAGQSMKVAYWDTLELVTKPKYAKFGWADPQRTYKEPKNFLYPSEKEKLLKEMEFGAGVTQFTYIPMGMPQIFRYKTLTPITRLQSWWMNYFTKFTRESIHRAFRGKTSYGAKLPWSRRLGYLKYLVIAGSMFSALGYKRSFLLGVLPTYLSPAAQLALGMYLYVASDSEWEKKKALSQMKYSWKAFIPGSGAWRNWSQVWTGEKPLEALFFYQEKLPSKKRSILKELGLGTRKRSILKELGL